jgi:hypothetical protein
LGRAVSIFLAFEHFTGHSHRHRDVVIGSYRPFLIALGWNEDANYAAIHDACRAAGLTPSRP